MRALIIQLKMDISEIVTNSMSLQTPMIFYSSILSLKLRLLLGFGCLRLIIACNYPSI